jgi:hypothetical protein
MALRENPSSLSATAMDPLAQLRLISTAPPRLDPPVADTASSVKVEFEIANGAEYEHVPVLLTVIDRAPPPPSPVIVSPSKVSPSTTTGLVLDVSARDTAPPWTALPLTL